MVALIEMYLLDCYLEKGSLSHKLKLFFPSTPISCKSYKQDKEKKLGDGHPILLHRHPRSGFVTKERNPKHHSTFSTTEANTNKHLAWSFLFSLGFGFGLFFTGVLNYSIICLQH